MFSIPLDQKSITFGVTDIAVSSDPLDFDLYIHHWAFSSVFAKLVSGEKKDGFFPMLASEWKYKNNYKTWEFKIRKDLNYSNGDRIKIQDIEINFKRLVYLKNKNKSNSGLLEFLIGFNNFSNLQGRMEGIQVIDDTILFHFIKPMPKLLEKISFGFYGIAHPSLFDQQTGSWINKLHSISSGAYEVDIWDKDNYCLKYRQDVKFNINEKPIEFIKFKVFIEARNAREIEQIDVLIAERGSLLMTNQFEFVNSPNKLKIGYVQVSSAVKLENPLSNLNIRKWLRCKFYQNLEKNNFPIVLSLFPTKQNELGSLIVDFHFEKPEFNFFTILSHQFNYSAKIEENKDKKSVTDYFSSAITAIGENSGVNLILENNKNEIYDIEILGSGIEASDYMDTVKFMFLSKEGIRLPDINGKIKEELKKESPDINFINQEIWDQAVIWPIRHYSSGYWFNKNSNIDYSEMNFESPSIDFQFLKWK